MVISNPFPGWDNLPQSDINKCPGCGRKTFPITTRFGKLFAKYCSKRCKRLADQKSKSDEVEAREEREFEDDRKDELEYDERPTDCAGVDL